MDKFGVPKITYSRKGEEQGLKYEPNKLPTYDELLAGVADISYQSPVEIISRGFETKLEGEVMKAIHSYGIVIDKDELIKALQYDRQQYEKGFADACKLNTRGEWISVEDRLPEEKVMVLGFSHTVFKDGGHYDKILVMELKNGLFVPFNCSPIKNGSVTHWMPLPEAPKMTRKEDEGK